MSAQVSEEVSLRPGAFRPGGAAAVNPLAAFVGGAGAKTSPAQKAAAPTTSAHKATLREFKEQQGLTQVKYSREFLETFAAENTRPPASLLNVKGLLVDDSGATPAVNASDGKAEENSWRPKGAAAAALNNSNVQRSSAAASGGGGGAPASSANRPTPSSMPPELRIETAADKGRTKWAPAKNVTDATKARNTVRGILNKLTPDNFDRLTIQVLEIVAVSDAVLRECIPLIFEKAVAEPTFCALYADLCSVLTAELESMDFGMSEGKPVTFKRELLNTCQDEFEGMEEQRDKLRESGSDDEYAIRRLKMRQLGTVRLLAELFNKDLVTQPIMRIVIGELMNRGQVDGKYDSDLIECIVQALTLCGAKMAAHEKLKKSVDSWLKKLSGWAKDTTLEARIRFKIQDLNDQVRAGWQTRRDTYTVKKTQEVRKQAQAELGMVAPIADQGVYDYLPKLQLARHGAAAPSAEAQMAELFPPTRDDPVDAAVDTASGGEDEKAAEPVKRGILSDEDVQKKARATFDEFLSIRDYNEAVTCIRELAATEAQDALIVAGALERMYDAQKDDEIDLLCKLVIHLVDSNCLSAAGIKSGIQAQTDNLEELSMDVPKSPMIIGKLLAAVLGAGAVQFDALEGYLEKIESAEPKRRMMRVVLSGLATELGQDTVVQMIKESGVHLGPLLDADAEFEPGMPSVFDFMKMENLQWVPL